MSEATPETVNFGLTRVGPGEQLSKNGYASLDTDRVDLDNILYAAITHVHNGSDRLADPTSLPTLTVQTTGGELPASTTFFYQVSLVDKYGLETAACPEANVTTGDPLTPPTAANVAIETTGGTCGTGTWAYLVTFITSSGGETTPSAVNSANITSGSTNRIRLTLPSLPSGASGYNIYRSRPGQNEFYYLDTTSSTTYYDPFNVEDQSITEPTENTTNSTNAINVTIPGGTIPDGCSGWKIYRALDSGGYDGNSLVHFVVEGSTDTSTDITTTWLDTGDVLTQGFPKTTSATITGGSIVDLSQISGEIPLTSAPRGSRILTSFGPGVLTGGQIINETASPVPVVPLRLTAYWQDPPNSSDMSIVISDANATPNTITLNCPAGATPVHYFELDYPLYTGASFEAEASTRSDITTIPIVSDTAASSGQVVSLTVNGQWVEADLGTLEPGVYQAYATVKVSAYATNTHDLVIQAIRTDTSAVLASTAFTLGTTPYPVTTAYVELTGPSFTAPGGVDVVLQVEKATTSTQSYYVDKMRYVATVPVLSTGPLTVTANAAGTNTDAGNVNVCLWF